MPTTNDLRIAVLPGDGIGTEVTEAALAVLDPLTRRHGLGLAFETLPAGAFHHRGTGEALSDATFRAADGADAILLGAMGWPGIRYPDGTEIGPQLDLRVRLGLCAGVRPSRAILGVPLALADPRAREMDLVILRKSTEGLFHSRGRGVVTEDAAEETLRITRGVAERLSRFALHRRRGVANPTAMVLSVAMMLDWLAAERGAGQAYADGAAELDAAVDRAFAGGLRTADMGGADGKADAVRAFLGEVGRPPD